MFEKVVDAIAASAPQHVRQAMISVTHAKNSLYSRSGTSPAMAVFGRAPLVPGELMSDENDLYTDASNGPFSVPASQELAIWTCAEATKAFAEYGASAQLRKRIPRQTRDPDKIAILPGMEVAFYRTHTAKGRFRRAGTSAREGGYLIGAHIGREAPEKGNNYFIQ